LHAVKRFLFLDFETRSKANLKKVGVDNYARHESTRVLRLAAALNDGAVGLWLPHLAPSMPAKLRALIEDPDVILVAHNAAFERAILNHVLGFNLPASRFICTMAMALSLSLPGALDQLVRDALQLKAEYQKLAHGKKFINRFCKPRKPSKNNPKEFNDWETHPEEWEDGCTYCKQDVIAERKVFLILRKFFPDLGEVFALWAYDQDVNNAGVPLDVDLIRGAIEITNIAKARYTKLLRDLSGLKNPNSVQQFLPWLQERGYPFASSKANRVKIAIDDFGDKMTDDCLEFLRLRIESNKTSLKKFNAMLLAMCETDHVLRGMLQFCGAARTGRWGGRVVQLQNLPRPLKHVEAFLDDVREHIRNGDYDALELLFGKPLDVLVSSIRSAIAAPPGKVLNVCDLSAIELCVLAWISQSKFWLNVLREKKDAYKSFGVHYLGKPYDEITKKERNECKPAALGCGYRLGGGDLVGEYPDQTKTGLWGYAASMGVQMTRDAAKKAVAVYRQLSPEVVQLWYDLENAARDCIADQQPRRVGMFVFDIQKPFMRIRLPSGRHLFYCRPKVERKKVEYIVYEDDGVTPKTEWVGDLDTGSMQIVTEVDYKWQMTYEGVHQTSKKWVRMDTHGGKLVENIVQAIARDILVHGMLKARDAGFNIITHVHDELVSLDDEDDTDHNHLALEDCMRDVPPWARGLPLDAHGFQSQFYKKD
jgi:DNA polymerase